jgi:hypothetical protein
MYIQDAFAEGLKFEASKVHLKAFSRLGILVHITMADEINMEDVRRVQLPFPLMTPLTMHLL